MYCPRLFIKNYIVYYNVYCFYCGVFIEKYVHTEFHRCVSELHGHLCPYRNILPEAVFVVLQELHCLPNCLHVCMIRV